ncbi:MAG: patatin-like phospholipase family protein [Cyanobacteriota bacterium]
MKNTTRPSAVPCLNQKESVGTVPGAAEQVGLKVWPFTRSGAGVIWTHPSALGEPSAGAASAGDAMPASVARTKAAATCLDQGRGRGMGMGRNGSMGGREGEVRTVPPGRRSWRGQANPLAANPGPLWPRPSGIGRLGRDTGLPMAPMALSTSPPLGLETRLASPGPKRVLALDGGGVRGILTLGFLERIEALLRERHGGDPEFRLRDYYDLIAGTSTGSIIAALLARGHSVAEVIDLYNTLARQVFRRSWWRRGVLRPRYRRKELQRFLADELGEDCTLGDADRLRTGLLIISKRLDTGKPWPIANNPRGQYFAQKEGSHTLANSNYPLWQVVRASTAAPTFFAPESIQINNPKQSSLKAETGLFLDGGVSPHNNPALQAYLYATLRGYNLCWPADPQRLLIHSAGTGRLHPGLASRGAIGRLLARITALQGITALMGLMNDCGLLVETLMQGMGTCLTIPRRIDAELGTLSGHELVDQPRFSYGRFDVKLFRDPKPRDGMDDEPILDQLRLDAKQLQALQPMDDPETGPLLLKLGRAAAAEKVKAEHFPACFDLPTAPPLPVALDSDGQPRRPYIKREEQPVVAVQLNLDTDGFRYHCWGAEQTCQRGDWIVHSPRRTYTVSAESFARTYQPLGQGLYRKHTPVWARQATSDGRVTTQEGHTHYVAGDWLVWNDPNGNDVYAISRDTFAELYEPWTAPAEPPG